MSSMVRIAAALLLAGTVLGGSTPVTAQDAARAPTLQRDATNSDAAKWDRARQALVASEPSQMSWAIDRWQQLVASSNLAFSDYASFLMSNPGFPEETKLRTYAEKRLDSEYVDTDRLIAFFDKFPPLTNPARAQYAVALSAKGRPEAKEMARAAWRGGTMSPTAEATLVSLHWPEFTQDDQDARMDALLWQGDAAGAARQLTKTSPAKQALFTARLYAVQGSDPRTLSTSPPANAMADPGYLFNLVQYLRKSGQVSQAVHTIANRPKLSSLPFDQEAWTTEMLSLARNADARSAERIAAGMDDAFAPGADISLLSYDLRDDYTSLMWLAGTDALDQLGDPAGAAPLFYRYGAAARTPPTRSKGFYWAGVAAQKAGDAKDAQAYFQQAAEYPERYYGQLALARLGKPMPHLAGQTSVQPTAEQRAAFMAKPLTRAVREVARDAPWSVGIRFYREIASQAQTEADMQLVADLARDIGRRDLAVILGEEAGAKGFRGFATIAYPTLVTPGDVNWTMVHAIARQESQFAQNAISHAGAQGLMQLMPGTAREQAGKIGVQYLSASLIDDPQYNIRLGDAYFGRLMDYFGGSYPLAVAAYNAGAGNVNKWLAANGDPRSGAVDWVSWVERIPISETRNYVQRVLENAVVYDTMHPEKADGGPKTIAQFLSGNSTLAGFALSSTRPAYPSASQ